MPAAHDGPGARRSRSRRFLSRAASHAVPAIIFSALLQLAFLAVCHPARAGIEMAVTVDDLPVHGPAPSGTSPVDISRKFLTAFEKHSVPEVYGFAVAGRIDRFPASVEVLRAWIEAGHALGNHTYSHSDLNQTELQSYLDDIRRNESLLSKLQPGLKTRMFRYPFLREGNTREKRERVRKFLSANGYRIAQVTVDFYDWAWNEAHGRCAAKRDVKSIDGLEKTYLDAAVEGLRAAERLSEVLFERSIRQILLLHIGSFTAVMLDALLAAYKANGVRFISLDRALRDEMYQIDPNVIRENPHTFLNQMRIARGLPAPARKEPPLRELQRVCR